MFQRLAPVEKGLARRLNPIYGNLFAKGATSAEDYHQGFRMNATGTRILRPSDKSVEPRWERRMPLVLNQDTQEPFMQVDIRHFERFEGFEVSQSHELMEQLLKRGLGWCQCLRRSELAPTTLTAVDDGGEWNSACVYRHKWKPGDTIIFHNSACLHTPTPSALYENSLPHRKMIQIIQAIGQKPSKQNHRYKWA